MIEQGELDFVVVPEMLLSPLHPSEVLAEDPYVCIAWSGNKLLKKGLSIDQFLSMGHATTRMILRKETMGEMMLQKSGMKPRFELILPAFSLLPIAVIGTDMIAIVNKRFADYYASYMPLKIFEVPIDLQSGKYMLQWNRYHDNDQGTQWLRRVLIDTVR